MNPGTPAGSRRVLAGLLALTLSGTLLVGHAVAVGGVTRSDLTSAEEAAHDAEQRFAEVRSALAVAEHTRTRLTATLQRLEDRRRSDLETAAIRESTLRSRIATMYMSAGGHVLPVVVGDVTMFSTRVAYLAAVTQDDRDALNRSVLSANDLAALQESAQQQLVVEEARIAELGTEVTRRAAELESARTHLAEVRDAWDRQEAARIAAEEAELRRQEAALAAALTTTTTVAGTITTTTRPPDYGYDPRRGVEQWRPIVAEVLADWGLDQTKCATRNGIEFCVSGQVDNAMSVMSCESNGVPFAENSRSGAAGLFQNLPYYWQSRVDRIRAYHSDKSQIPSDASIWNPEYNTIVAALLVWESRETLLGNRGGGGVSPAVWPEFNWERYATSGYGYSGWGKGPNPWGHWTCGIRVGVYDLAWVHPWATQQTAP